MEAFETTRSEAFIYIYSASEKGRQQEKDSARGRPPPAVLI